MIGIIVIMMILVLGGTTYAYYAISFEEKQEEAKTNLNSELLSDTVIVSNIEDSAGSFQETNIYPGHKEVASIKIEVRGREF